MKNLLLIMLVVALNCLMAWIVYGPWLTREVYVLFMVVLLFGTPTFRNALDALFFDPI